MIEPYRVVEHSVMGFSFEKYANSEIEAIQILGRRIQEHRDNNKPCTARIEVAVDNRYYVPLTEQSRSPLPYRYVDNIPIGACSILPSFTEKIEWVSDRKLAPTKLRSIGASKGLTLTEFRIGMNKLALTSKGDYHTPLPLQDIDAIRELALDLTGEVRQLDERLLEMGPIRPGLVICATIRNDGDTVARVAVVVSVVPLAETPE